MRDELVGRFGGGVDVQYIDVFSVDLSQYDAVMRVVARGDVPLPIISIDGKPRFAGGVSSQVVGDALEQMGFASVAS
ncbi:MAG: hypothetical protein ACYC4L_11015 [Chloroflexota bacterium]